MFKISKKKRGPIVVHYIAKENEHVTLLKFNSGHKIKNENIAVLCKFFNVLMSHKSSKLDFGWTILACSSNISTINFLHFEIVCLMGDNIKIH